jgi:hypothetical protein
MPETFHELHAARARLVLRVHGSTFEGLVNIDLPSGGGRSPPPRQQGKRGGRGVLQLVVHATTNTHLGLFERLSSGGGEEEEEDKGEPEAEFPFREQAAPAPVSAAVFGARITGKINYILARKSSWRLGITGWLTLRLFTAADEPDHVVRYRLFEQFVRIVIPKSDPPDRSLEKVGTVYSSNESVSGGWPFVRGSEPDLDFERLFRYACRTFNGGVIMRCLRTFTGGVMYFLHDEGAAGLSKTVFLVFKPRNDRAAVLAVGRGAMQKFHAFTTGLVRDTLLPFDTAAPCTAVRTMRAGYLRLPRKVNAGAMLQASAAARAGYDQEVFPAVRVVWGGVTFIYYANSCDVIATSGNISDEALNAAVRKFTDDIVENGGQGAVARDTRAPARAVSVARPDRPAVMRASRFVGASSHRAAPVAVSATSTKRRRGGGPVAKRQRRWGK